MYESSCISPWCVRANQTFAACTTRDGGAGSGFTRGAEGTEETSGATPKLREVLSGAGAVDETGEVSALQLDSGAGAVDETGEVSASQLDSGAGIVDETGEVSASQLDSGAGVSDDAGEASASKLGSLAERYERSEHAAKSQWGSSEASRRP